MVDKLSSDPHIQADIPTLSLLRSKLATPTTPPPQMSNILSSEVVSLQEHSSAVARALHLVYEVMIITSYVLSSIEPSL